MLLNVCLLSLPCSQSDSKLGEAYTVAGRIRDNDE